MTIYNLDPSGFSPFEITDPKFQNACRKNPCYGNALYDAAVKIKQMLKDKESSLLIYDPKRMPSAELIFEVTSDTGSKLNLKELRNVLPASSFGRIEPELYSIQKQGWEGRVLVRLIDTQRSVINFG